MNLAYQPGQWMFKQIQPWIVFDIVKLGLRNNISLKILDYYLDDRRIENALKIIIKLKIIIL